MVERRRMDTNVCAQIYTIFNHFYLNDLVSERVSKIRLGLRIQFKLIVKFK